MFRRAARTAAVSAPPRANTHCGDCTTRHPPRGGSQKGGSTLHTVEFDSGRVENVRLAKTKGGKGERFVVLKADEV